MTNTRCRWGDWSGISWKHHVCRLCWLFHHLSVRHRHVQSTRSSHWSQWNATSDRHRRLYRWSSTVHRRLGQWKSVYLADVRWWSIVRGVSADHCDKPRGNIVSDVTSSAGDVAPQSEAVQHHRQATATCHRVVSSDAAVSQHWDDMRDVYRRIQDVALAVRGEYLTTLFSGQKFKVQDISVGFGASNWQKRSLP